MQIWDIGCIFCIFATNNVSTSWIYYVPFCQSTVRVPLQAPLFRLVVSLGQNLVHCQTWGSESMTLWKCHVWNCSFSNVILDTVRVSETVDHRLTLLNLLALKVIGGTKCVRSTPLSPGSMFPIFNFVYSEQVSQEPRFLVASCSWTCFQYTSSRMNTSDLAYAAIVLRHGPQPGGACRLGPQIILMGGHCESVTGHCESVISRQVALFLKTWKLCWCHGVVPPWVFKDGHGRPYKGQKHVKSRT